TTQPDYSRMAAWRGSSVARSDPQLALHGPPHWRHSNRHIRIAPGIVLVEQGAQHDVVVAMAGADAADAADDRPAGEIKVTDAVQHLVPDEFVLEAQPVLVEDPAVADHHRVLERAAAGEPGGAQPR